MRYYQDLAAPLLALAQTTGVPLTADPLASSAPQPLKVDERIAAVRVELLGTDTPEGEGLPTDLAGLRSLIRTMLGQQQMPTGQWGMSHYRLAVRVAALENVQAAQQLVLDALAAGFSQQSTQLQALTANLQLAQQTNQQLTAAQNAYDLRLAANDAKDALIASATEANRLELVKANAAAALREAQALKDAAAIAEAKALATQAKADAAAAQKTANEDAAAVLVAQAAATAAQTTATNAQAAVAALAAKFRSATVTVPSMLIGGSVDVVATFPAFADTAFVVIAEPAGLALLGLDATEVTTARTASSATFRIKNVLGLAIASGGTLSVFAYRP